jgi:putative hemolysin
VNAYDGLEEQPVSNLPSVVIKLADSKSALEHTSHLRFTLFRDERQHQIDIAGVQRPARGGHDGPVQ